MDSPISNVNVGPATHSDPTVPASDLSSTNLLHDQIIPTKETTASSDPIINASAAGGGGGGSNDPSSDHGGSAAVPVPVPDVGPTASPASVVGLADLAASDLSSTNLQFKDHIHSSSPTKETTAPSDLIINAAAAGGGGGGSTSDPSSDHGGSAAVPAPDVGPADPAASDLRSTDLLFKDHSSPTKATIASSDLSPASDVGPTISPASDLNPSVNNGVLDPSLIDNSPASDLVVPTSDRDELPSDQDPAAAPATPLLEPSPAGRASFDHVPLTTADVGPTAEPPPSASSSAPLHACLHTDNEIVHKFAQLLLPGLATACVDSTTGDLFRSPATVAVDLRRDLTDHITLRSDTYVPETLSLLHSPDSASLNLPDLDDPLDILAALLDDFTATKRNLLGRVSNWLLSDSREDKIDEFVQEMEMNNFWKLSLRETIADLLLKNLDYKNAFHCSMKFDTQEELERHVKECSFRPVGCRNDGCKVKYCKVHEEKHEEVCPYKVLECEQRCGERIVRREMDRHCITVCRMKMVNCPFYQVGCQSAFPQCQLREHCREFLRQHLVGVLAVKNEEGLGEDELKAKAESMEKSRFREELEQALDLRPLTMVAKSVEGKMKKQRQQEN